VSLVVSEDHRSADWADAHLHVTETVPWHHYELADLLPRA
jgi:hypothetical protein